MFFWKQKPKRLYMPVKSHWYTRPRRESAIRPRNIIVLKKRGLIGFLKDLAQKSVYWAIGLVGAGILVCILFLSSYFTIKSVEVDRENFNIDSAKIENRLNSFVGKNLVFFPKSRVIQAINREFPEFSDVQVQKLFPSKLKIKLVNHPVVANLRGYYILPPSEEPLPENFTELNKAIEELSPTDPSLLSATSQNPLVDKKATEGVFNLEPKEDGEESGAVEQKALLNRIGQAIFDQEENLELMTFIVRGLTQPVEDREFVIPRKTMDYLMDTLQYFNNSMGLEVLSLEYFTVAQEAHLKTKNGLMIWLSVDRDYKIQIDKLKTIYEPAELNREDLAYIDLRIKDKVIYCVRGTRCDKKTE
jgi:cell division septal protein FtsQ